MITGMPSSISAIGPCLSSRPQNSRRANSATGSRSSRTRASSSGIASSSRYSGHLVRYSMPGPANASPTRSLAAIWAKSVLVTAYAELGSGAGVERRGIPAGSRCRWCCRSPAPWPSAVWRGAPLPSGSAASPDGVQALQNLLADVASGPPTESIRLGACAWPHAIEAPGRKTSRASAASISVSANSQAARMQPYMGRRAHTPRPGTFLRLLQYPCYVHKGSCEDPCGRGVHKGMHACGGRDVGSQQASGWLVFVAAVPDATQAGTQSSLLQPMTAISVRFAPCCGNA